MGGFSITLNAKNRWCFTGFRQKVFSSSSFEPVPPAWNGGEVCITLSSIWQKDIRINF